jgi:uridine kinase
MDTIKVKINNNIYSYEKGIKLESIAKDFINDYKGIITLGKIDNKLKDLSTKIDKDCEV